MSYLHRVEVRRSDGGWDPMHRAEGSWSYCLGWKHALTLIDGTAARIVEAPKQGEIKAADVLGPYDPRKDARNVG